VEGLLAKLEDQAHFCVGLEVGQQLYHVLVVEGALELDLPVDVGQGLGGELGFVDLLQGAGLGLAYHSYLPYFGEPSLA
jgi:hypothetical protein